MVLEADGPLSPSGAYRTAPEGASSVEDYLELVRALPLVTEPEVFIMHENANITKDQNETNKTFASILLTQTSGGVSTGKSEEEVMREVADARFLTDCFCSSGSAISLTLGGGLASHFVAWCGFCNFCRTCSRRFRVCSTSRSRRSSTRSCGANR